MEQGNIKRTGWLVYPLLTVALLLPLKFGGLTGVPEAASLFPADLFEALIVTWPAMLFPLFSGVLLALCLMFSGQRDTTAESREYRVYTWLWILLFAVTLLGLINASARVFAYLQVVHIAGQAALAGAAVIVLRRYPESRQMLLTVVAAACVLTVLSGIQQYFSGFQETLAMLQQQYDVGSDKARDIEHFLEDRRIFATFTLPNTLAGYLLLVAPLCFVGLWKVCGRIEPPSLSRALFVPALGLILGFAFLMTRSRAAFLSLILAGGLWMLLLPFARRYRIMLGIAAALTLIAGTAFIYCSSRGFSSIIARLDYNFVSLKLLLSHPLTGAGWGDFFHEYMRLKLLPTHEAPHTPHSFLMAYASQTGIAGLFAAAGIMLYPLWNGLRRLGRSDWREAVSVDNAILFGLTAWTVHSLLDVNMETPGSIGSAVLLSICLLTRTAPMPDRPRRLPARAVLLWVIALTAAAGSVICVRGEARFAHLTELCNLVIRGGDGLRPTPHQIRDAYLAAEKAQPWSPFPDATMARFLLAVGDTGGAELLYRKALEKSPLRPSFHYELSRVLQQRGDTTAAAASLNRARELFPNNARYFEDAATSAGSDR